jgi:flavin-binding protein dodecin
VESGFEVGRWRLEVESGKVEKWRVGLKLEVGSWKREV